MMGGTWCVMGDYGWSMDSDTPQGIDAVEYGWCVFLAQQAIFSAIDRSFFARDFFPHLGFIYLDLFKFRDGPFLHYEGMDQFDFEGGLLSMCFKDSYV